MGKNQSHSLAPAASLTLQGRPFGRQQFFVIAGPCVIESEELTLAIARELAAISQRLDLPLIFKASYDKANRTSLDSFRGPGIVEGLSILARVGQETGLPLISDIHTPAQAAAAAEVLSVLQIPAFLCRQTDLLVAAAQTGKVINIKKGQFVAPADMGQAVAKVRATGNQQIWLTERGSCFGYNNLVVDMRGIAIMQGLGCPVVFDATHSVQLPGGLGQVSGGDRRFIAPLARAAVAAGADAVFLEVHPDPDKALCDGPNSLPLGQLEGLLKMLQALYALVRQQG
ncbi:MAG: 3-deoxy-8-phosphooctulonate synthase [Desulfarculus sp.]|nr:3-deoxy-8-phosphooctulonate synthase [Desulfarculus sp.]